MRLRVISCFLIKVLVGRLDHNSGCSAHSLLHAPNTNGQILLPSDEEITLLSLEVASSRPCSHAAASNQLPKGFHRLLGVSLKWSAVACEQGLGEATLRLKSEFTFFFFPFFSSFFKKKFWQEKTLTQLLRGRMALMKLCLVTSQWLHCRYCSLSSGWSFHLCSPCGSVGCSKAGFPSPSTVESCCAGENFYLTMEEITILLVTRFPFSSAVVFGKANQQWRLNYFLHLSHHSYSSSLLSLPLMFSCAKHFSIQKLPGSEKENKPLVIGSCYCLPKLYSLLCLPAHPPPQQEMKGCWGGCKPENRA